jgi:hypothetical protein
MPKEYQTMEEMQKDGRRPCSRCTEKRSTKKQTLKPAVEKDDNVLQLCETCRGVDGLRRKRKADKMESELQEMESEINNMEALLKEKRKLVDKMKALVREDKKLDDDWEVMINPDCVAEKIVGPMEQININY